MSRLGVPSDVRLLAGLLLLGIALAPHAAAQATPPNQSSITAYLEDPGHPLAPGANETVVLKLTYTPGTGAVPSVYQDPNDPTNSGLAPTHITFAPKVVPTWVEEVSFDPRDVNVSFTPGQGAPPQVAVDVILRIAKTAPAGNHQNLSIAVHADPNGAATAADSVSTELMLRPGIVPQVKVEREQKGQVIVKGGREQAIRFLVTNTGNGDVTARLNVTTRPQDSIVDFPTTLTLKPGQTLPVDVMLRLPWTYGEAGTLELEATPTANEEDGKPAQAEVDIAGQSAVPGAELPTALATLGLLALLRRRQAH